LSSKHLLQNVLAASLNLNIATWILSASPHCRLGLSPRC